MSCLAGSLSGAEGDAARVPFSFQGGEVPAFDRVGFRNSVEFDSGSQRCLLCSVLAARTSPKSTWAYWIPPEAAVRSFEMPRAPEGPSRLSRLARCTHQRWDHQPSTQSASGA
jgi:hypothetical protein